MPEVYLSELTIDPWRRNAARLLSDTYALHQRLLMAFPEAADGGGGRILFRVDTGKGGLRLLVQSTVKPEWSRLEGLALECRGPKAWNPNFTAGQTLHFRLRANMTVKQNGKRRVLHGASAEDTRSRQALWLARKGEQHGFALLPLPTGEDWFDPFGEEQPAARAEARLTPVPVRTGSRPARDGREAMEIAHTGVDCEGILRVTDPALFAAAVAGGIGPAKAFGFGLLSVAPVR